MARSEKNLFLKTGRRLLDFVEITIPSTMFALLFIVFMMEIFYRYVLVPLTWTLEFTLMAFIWTTLLGACYAHREGAHVTFSLLYDRMKPRGQLYVRMAGNLLVFTAFCIALYPSYKYIAFMGFKRSDVLRIPMNIAFSPYLAFLVIMIGRLAAALADDLRKALRGES